MEREPTTSQGLDLLFAALAAEKVSYAVIGAIAMALHGLPRATADIDLFIEATHDNVERLKRALRRVWDDPAIDEISANDLCGDYPAVRYYPPSGFFLDILTRLGTVFTWDDLEIEKTRYRGIPVRVITPRTLWRMKRDTVRPGDRFDAARLAERFGLGDDT